MSRRLRPEGDTEAGFTLVEVMVALVILGLVAVALIPVLVTSSRAEQYARQATVAKNLTQQRIDVMRNLPFHVDAQNGPFLDLLDDYYTNIKTTTTSLPSGGIGQWFSSGTVPGSSASGPYFQSTFTDAFGVKGMTQNVYAQFLTSAQPVPAVVPASTLTNMGYDSATVGKDQPPSLLLGVTVVTSWTGIGGAARSHRSYTEITNTGTDNSLIVSQARSTALQVKSTAYDGTPLVGALGVVKADGSLANTSAASGYAQGAYITDNGVGINSTAYSAISPPNPSGSTAAQAAGSQTHIGSSGSCGWGSFGQTQVSDVSANTASGLPIAPSDVGTGATPAAKVQAKLLPNGGADCSGFSFSNQIDGSSQTDPSLQLPSNTPMVQVSDGTGSSPVTTSSGWVEATSNTGSAGAVSSGASVAFSTRVQIFPGLPFMQNGTILNQSTCSSTGAISGTAPCGNGLVNVFLTSASLSCSSGGSPSASYNGYLTYYTSTGWKSVALSWTQSSTGADPLASIDPTKIIVTTYNGLPVTLGNYIGSWSTARSLTTSSSGQAALSNIVAITTAPTRSGDSASTIGVGVGNLSCVATDNR